MERTELRNDSYLWWIELNQGKQQRLADKYHPKDDFSATSSNINRIEQIYLKENEKDN